MNEIKNILFLIITVTLSSSCNNSNSKNKFNAPGDPSTDSTDTIQSAIIVDSIQIDTAHRSLIDCNPNPTGTDLLMTVKPQQAYFWCWAACAEMVMEKFRDATISQCDEANKQFNRADCCNSPTPDQCNEGGWPEFEKYGFSADTTHSQALTWEDVKTQIDCQKIPFCFTWQWRPAPGNGGHMMVASGYKTENGENYVYILDPDPVGEGHPRWILYAEYVSGPTYTHWDDYFNIRRR